MIRITSQDSHGFVTVRDVVVGPNWDGDDAWLEEGILRYAPRW